MPATTFAIGAVRISYDLYGNDVVSSFHLAKGLTRTVDSSYFISVIPEDVI